MTLLEPPSIETIDVDPDAQADIDKFREVLADYQAGVVSEDVFRVFRLTNGIYGQRQGGTNQMLRVKVPYGAMTAAQFDMMAYLVERYSRGWGHITTRQCLQFHYVQLDQVPDVMQHLASVGLTTREACGDTVRNVQGCHLAGACPTKCSMSPRGPRRPIATSFATPLVNACPASSRSISPDATPTVARRCSTMWA
jgi:sulfite reductase beta subunit-like hemoprotein